MSQNFYKVIEGRLSGKKHEGTYKTERILTSPQGPEIMIEGREKPVLNFCANNYLGLAAHPEVIKAARDAMSVYGHGMASVRFICGTESLHKKLEEKIARFFGTEDAILYTSCFDANGGLFECVLESEDAIISADLNHASIIDGIRLSKAQRRLYPANDMSALEAALMESAASRLRLVMTDGVFSMEGDLAPLGKIAPICKRFEAILAVDDSHATGFLGANGRGTAEELGVHGEVDIFTSTLGKALGGASGGFVTGKRILIEWLRNSSRPYLFSNSLPPALAAGSLKALEIVESDEGRELRERLRENTIYFRDGMTAAGFKIKPGIHPIIPIMIGDAKIAGKMATALLDEGIYVISFSYPVVPKGTARIRVQISAVHTKQHLDRAIRAFSKVGKEQTDR